MRKIDTLKTVLFCIILLGSIYLKISQIKTEKQHFIDKNIDNISLKSDSVNYVYKASYGL
jgi:hypothetical protein